jgi:hypothetical protein
VMLSGAMGADQKRKQPTIDSTSSMMLRIASMFVRSETTHTIEWERIKSDPRERPTRKVVQWAPRDT